MNTQLITNSFQAIYDNADKRLIDVAQNEGLETINTNDHECRMDNKFL